MSEFLRKFIILVIICLSINYSLTQSVFNAHRAGTWYPQDKKNLNYKLKNLLHDAKYDFDAKLDGSKIRALICPHAGYVYSGEIAAAVYRLISKKHVDRVIILAPSHFVPLKGIALPKFSKYRLPIGTLDLDVRAIEELAENSLSVKNNDFFKPEHSVEMELPFIKFLLPRSEIIPIIVGSLTDDEVNEVATLLEPLIDKHTIVVVSTDFTHYGKSFDFVPFKDNVLLRVNQLDSTVLNSIQHQNYRKFQSIIKKTQDTVCGYEPLKVLLKLLNLNVFGQVDIKLIAYGTSADVTNDTKNLVSYAGLVVTNQINNKILNMQEKKSLLKYSRNILNQTFKKRVDVDLLKPIMTLLLEEPKGVFVTLYKFKNGKKELRGCIGTVQVKNALYKNVADMTLQAAYHDPRFLPLKENELSEVIIDISVLGEPKPINSYKEIILNKHGIILENSGKSALFLPSVPKDFGFDLPTTLEQLSLKAGLDKDFWKLPETKFQVFETQDFMEPTKTVL